MVIQYKRHRSGTNSVYKMRWEFHSWYLDMHTSTYIDNTDQLKSLNIDLRFDMDYFDNHLLLIHSWDQLCRPDNYTRIHKSTATQHIVLHFGMKTEYKS